jgi:hypothetical protein
MTQLHSSLVRADILQTGPSRCDALTAAGLAA